jgi:acyl-CoA thioesterase FadM
VVSLPRQKTRIFSSHSTIKGVSSTSVDTPEQVEKSVQLISKPMQLFIEDTDAYQVKYNGNYIRSYERALFQIAEEVKLIDKTSVLTDENFILLGVTKHKFKSSPKLGDRFQVLAKRMKKLSECENTEEWQLEMVHYQSDSSDHSSNSIVFNTATVSVANFESFQSNCHLRFFDNTDISSFGFDSSTVSHSYSFHLNRDEFDVHMPGILPIRTALNIFERSRSNALGGPDLLEKMRQSGLLWVVTSIDEMFIEPSVVCRPGEEVLCLSTFDTKRNGMIVECKQEICKMVGSHQFQTIARGIVTLCAIDAKTLKPTKNIPDFVKEIFSN